jgi:hypothetical protein
MKILTQVLGSFLFIVATTFFLTTPASAKSPKGASPKIYFVQMAPLKITNNLKALHGDEVLLAYIQVTSKQTGKELCAWMPRVRDAFVMVVRNPLVRVNRSNNAQKTKISVILKRAAHRVVPPRLVANVMSFNPYNPKEFKAERKLKPKLRCKDL